jgi:MEMO1 family protein
MIPRFTSWPPLRALMRVWLISSSVALLIFSPNCEADTMKGTRPSALAGTWYSADPRELAAAIDRHLTRGQPLSEIATQPPIAILAPHAGHRFSGDAAGAAFRLLEGAGGQHIQRVILLGPSHHQAFSGASILTVDRYETPLGAIPIDIAVAQALLEHPRFHTRPDAHRSEHCLEIELPFLQRVLRHPFRIVPILVSNLDTVGWRDLAGALAQHIDAHTLIVISSDFCHYGGRFGYLPFEDDPDRNLRRLDKGALAPILARDPAALAAYKRDTDITVCGLRPIGVLLELLRQPQAQTVWGGCAPEGRVLDYYRSADLIGDFDGSVSYASVAFFPAGSLLPGDVYPEMLRDVQPWGQERAGEPNMDAPTPHADARLTITEAERRFLLNLARQTLERKLSGQDLPDPETLPEDVSPRTMETVCGVFVTLNKNHQLRGCIGHIVGRESLVQGVISNAVSAALRDPRFPAVELDELDRIQIEISVLTPLRRVSDPGEIEVGRHGVVLERAGQRAVFLPQVATEWGWDRPTLLERLSIKAGLPRDAWRQDTEFHVFEAIVFEEQSR